MRTTTLSEFQESIRATGGYRTAPDCRAVTRAKPSAWTTLRYTWGVTRVFPCCALAEPLGKLTTDVWAGFCFSAVTTAERLGMNVLVEGFKDRLAHKGPVLYVCNHLSMTETILLPPVLLSISPFSYVAKASLAHLPFLEKAAEHMRMVPISRVSPREDLQPQAVLVDRREARRARGLPGRPACRGHALPADAQDGAPAQGLQGLRAGRHAVRHQGRLRAGDPVRAVARAARGVVRLDGDEA